MKIEIPQELEDRIPDWVRDIEVEQVECADCHKPKLVDGVDYCDDCYDNHLEELWPELLDEPKPIIQCANEHLFAHRKSSDWNPDTDDGLCPRCHSDAKRRATNSEHKWWFWDICTECRGTIYGKKMLGEMVVGDNGVTARHGICPGAKVKTTVCANGDGKPVKAKGLCNACYMAARKQN